MGREILLGQLAPSAADLQREARRQRRRMNTPCGLCGQLRTPEGHDACLGTLPGVQAACCGHGKGEGYVMLETGHTIRGHFDHVERLRGTLIRPGKRKRMAVNPAR